MAKSVTLPTLSELNELSSAQNCLILLRTLCTSDLTFTYMLLRYDTVLDIVKMCQDLLVMDVDVDHLSVAEHNEYVGYMKDLIEYAR